MYVFPIWMLALLGRIRLNDVGPDFRFCSNSLGIATQTTLYRRRESYQVLYPKIFPPLFHKKSQLRAFPDFSDWLKNHSNRLFLSVYPKLGFPLILNQSKQIIRVSTDLVEFGSGFDQEDVSLTVNPKLGFAHAFSKGIESTVFQLTVLLL